MSNITSGLQKLVNFLILIAFLVFAVASFSASPVVAFAQDAATATPTVTATPEPPYLPDTGKKGELQQYFLNAFAQQLGVSPEKVISAYNAAGSQTLDQAVSVGYISKPVADSLRGHLDDMDGYGMEIFMLDRDPFPWDKYFLYLSYLKPQFVIAALNMKGQDVVTKLHQGESVAEMAKEQNLDMKDVKQSIITDMNAGLDAAVASKTISRASATSISNHNATMLDYILGRKLTASFFVDKDDRGVDLDQR
jgi:hypothetical protein